MPKQSAPIVWRITGVVDASDLGFPPGMWPETVRVPTPEAGDRGIVVLRRDSQKRDPDGELCGWMYTAKRDEADTGLDIELTVLND
jgi:hypothetical protein